MNGYLTREGSFIPTGWGTEVPDYCVCSSVEEEAEMLETEGMVKLASALPGKYLYLSKEPLSKAQSDWLIEKGYMLDSRDIKEVNKQKIRRDLMNRVKDDNLNLKDFVEHYIAHNTIVNLYKEKRLKGGFRAYKKIWMGMDWQIVCGPDDENYFKAHPNVEKCPFVDRKVIKVLGGFENEINTVDNINLCVGGE